MRGRQRSSLTKLTVFFRHHNPVKESCLSEALYQAVRVEELFLKNEFPELLWRDPTYVIWHIRSHQEFATSVFRKIIFVPLPFSFLQYLLSVLHDNLPESIVVVLGHKHGW